MDPKEKFLELLAKHRKLENQMQQLAWEIAPDDVKHLLCGKEGLLADNQKVALEWLITPRWQLNDKCPIEAIINGEVEEVKKILRGLINEVYF